jgi:phage replication-related protein YjqB (UPF0714/DUF867 family)
MARIGADRGPPRNGHRDRYASYAELAAAEREGVDYRVVVREVEGASIAVVTPHGGGIERGTTQIARAIAGDVLHLYVFEGLKTRGNFDALHITSRRFDEPRCLDLVTRSETVLTVHGCVGFDERVYIGGLHEELKGHIALALEAIGVEAWLDNHNFPAIDPENICNRGRSGRGVQLEFTTGLRRLMQYGDLAASIRTAVLGAFDR